MFAIRRIRSLILAGVLLLAIVPTGSSLADASQAGLREGCCVNCDPPMDEISGQLREAAGPRRIELLIRRGERFEALGHYPGARSDFRTALDEARRDRNPRLAGIAMQALGYVHLLQGDAGQAEPLLLSGLETARTLGDPSLVANGLNRLASLRTLQNRRETAFDLYREALEFAIRAKDPGLEAAIRRNMTRVLDGGERPKAELRAALKAAERVAHDSERCWLMLEIGAEAQRWWHDADGTAFQYYALNRALSTAVNMADTRLISLTVGKLGAVYERRGRFQEALDLTGQAMENAQQMGAHELLLQWEWQLGRILRATGNRGEALSSFRRAVYHIQAIRQDIPIRYRDGRSSFQETLAPIYFELADILLEQAAAETGEQAVQNLLREARDTVELIKRSEMRDYFQDPCIIARIQKIESLSRTTAVLYPIIMPNRLELLVDIGGTLFRRTADVTRETLGKTVAALAEDLRNRKDVIPRANRVYDWLIRPVMPVLSAHPVDTLVFVPDGALRMLPIAALWDGERYLVERYAVATVPGLTLLDPKPLPRTDMDTLLAGMSEPGPVVLDLPRNMWEGFRTVDLDGVDRGVRGLSTVPAAVKAADAPPAGDRQSESDVDHVKKVLSLPGVSEEIGQLSRKVRGQVLMNREFQLDAFTHEFKRQPYRVVHIASHGFFGGEPDQNFIMTYDKLLTMNRLAALVKTKQLAERPVELITLSACQTAEGDDRSPMGLTGVALKSGARSALGSLWPVSDSAAQQLLPAFYSHLENPETTKAQALRRAQIDLMQQPRFRHPFFWSPFILAGNWL